MAQILEDSIAVLEARIQQLQDPQMSTTPAAVPSSYAANQSPPGGLAFQRNASQSFAREPSKQVIEKLLDCFLLHPSEFGFFLNVPRFRHSMTTFPPGHPSRPSPALSFAVYLWGANLSRDASLMAHESAYLNRAAQEIAVNLSGNHPRKIIEGVQADVLLAYYFFFKARFSEGKYYVTSAVSTTLAAGLHRLPPARSTSNTALMILPARDAVEEAERIIGIWTVLALDKAWAVALDETPNLVTLNGKHDTQIDIPWPLDMEDYEQGRFVPQQTSQTLHKFLSNIPTSDVGSSKQAVHAKAVILWESVADFCRTCKTGIPQQEATTLRGTFNSLDLLIERLIASLPPTDRISAVPHPANVRRLVFALSLLHISTICLHDAVPPGNEVSKQKRLNAAQSILEIVTSIKPRNLGYINPVIGFIWVKASNVITTEVSILQASRGYANPAGSSSRPEERLLRVVQRALPAMQAYSSTCVLTDFQVNSIKEAINAL